MPEIDLEMMDAWYSPIQRMIDTYEEGEELFHEVMFNVGLEIRKTAEEVVYKRYLNMEFLPTVHNSKWCYVYKHFAFNSRRLNVNAKGSGFGEFYLDIARGYARSGEGDFFYYLENALYQEPKLRGLVREAQEIYNATKVFDELVG